MPYCAVRCRGEVPNQSAVKGAPRAMRPRTPSVSPSRAAANSCLPSSTSDAWRQTTNSKPTLKELSHISASVAEPVLFDRFRLQVLFFTGSGSFSYKNRLKVVKKMFLPSHLHTGSDQKVPVQAPAPQNCDDHTK